MLKKTKFKRNRVVVRIEHPENGLGIYQNGSDERKTRIREIDKVAGDAHQHMRSLREYFNLCDNFECYFCAYLSIGDMAKYQTRRAIEGLIAAGYIIFELKIAKGFSTCDQVFYKKEDVVGQINITHLFHHLSEK